VRLPWQDNSADETDFRIERRASGAFAEIATVGANSTAFTAAGLAPATTYEFRVRARNGGGSSAYSNVATATTPPQGPQPPAAPGDLVATALSPSAIQLTWEDRSANETSFSLEARSYGGFAPLAALPAGTTGYTAAGLAAATPYEFRVRAQNAAGSSPFSNLAAAATRGLPGPCVEDGTTLCLLSGALRVEANWRNQHAAGTLGVGHAVPLSAKSGAFWFFRDDNVEVVAKGLDGRPVNGHYWFFYGGLSDVEYWLRVTKTASGEVAVFHNPPGEICGGADVTALPEAAGALPGSVRAVTGSCAPAPDTLCLLGGRFAVRVTWANPSNGSSGVGRPVAAADRTGYFWFFNDQNYELVVKALDGRAVNGHFWFFYGALSDVEYQIEVTDTATGDSRTYANPAGEICGRGDAAAF
jgi:hypothetical protein